MKQINASRFEAQKARPEPLNSCRRATLGFAPSAALAMLLLVHAVGMVHGASRVVYVIRLEDKVINPVTARYIVHGIKRAEETRAEALALVLDTPGGLVTSMKEIVTRMANSRVPIVVYVGPRGAMAGSAGVFITMASHVAAMAPETSIGAAHPVQLEPNEGQNPNQQEQSPKSNREVLNEKTTNILVSMVKSIAKPRGRNVEWAEKAVRKSVAATAEEALKLKVVEYVSPSLEDLLKRINGKTISLMGTKRQLHTNPARIQELPMTWSERFLLTISGPELSYILMSIAMLGLVYEFMNPGAVLPGIVGGICLLLSLFSMSILPINYAGVALVLLGVGLMVADIKVLSHGVLTTGGVIAFLLGSVMFIDPAYPDLKVPWRAILPMVVVFTAFFALCVGKGLEAQKRKVVTGREGMVGSKARARSRLNPEGKVFAEGEIWNAEALEGVIEEGERVTVVGVDGLILKVKRE